MTLVVDANVVAYFLLGTAKLFDEVRELWRGADELIAPSVWEAELATVVWMAACAKVVTREQATSKLLLAGRLRHAPRAALRRAWMLLGNSGALTQSALAA